MRTRLSLRSLLITIAMLTISMASFAQIEISVNFAPPELPVYEQPLCPGDGYIWTPGYWAWDGDDYFWVPGTWVLAPQPGYFWTPGYWAWGGNGYVFREGYWAPQVGFYGGINYGYGYFGHGYEGGRWDGDRFYYNRSVNNINVTEIRNVYNTTVVNDYRGPRVSYNGGNGGINARPTPDEERVARERRLPPVAVQTQHVEAARSNPAFRVSENHGKPPVAATPRPAAFNDRGVVPAQQGGRYTPGRQENSGGRVAVHPNDLPPVPRATPANTGDPNRDRKYQQQQQNMYAQQDQERQKLQQQQEQEHQKMQQRQASDQERQQMEQRHQQQTQELSQRHAQQQQQMQPRQQPHQEAPHENGRQENGKP